MSIPSRVPSAVAVVMLVLSGCGPPRHEVEGQARASNSAELRVTALRSELESAYSCPDTEVDFEDPTTFLAGVEEWIVVDGVEQLEGAVRGWPVARLVARDYMTAEHRVVEARVHPVQLQVINHPTDVAAGPYIAGVGLEPGDSTASVLVVLQELDSGYLFVGECATDTFLRPLTALLGEQLDVGIEAMLSVVGQGVPDVLNSLRSPADDVRPSDRQYVPGLPSSSDRPVSASDVVVGLVLASTEALQEDDVICVRSGDVYGECATVDVIRFDGGNLYVAAEEGMDVVIELRSGDSPGRAIGRIETSKLAQSGVVIVSVASDLSVRVGDCSLAMEATAELPLCQGQPIETSSPD